MDLGSASASLVQKPPVSVLGKKLYQFIVLMIRDSAIKKEEAILKNKSFESLCRSNSIQKISGIGKN